MKACQFCGMQINDNAGFCPSCGKQVVLPAPQAVAAVDPGAVNAFSAQPAVVPAGAPAGAPAGVPAAAPVAAPPSRIVLKRKSGFYGFAVAWTVFVNGTKIGTVGNGKTMEFLLPPGRHQLQVKSMGMSSDSMVLNLVGGEVLNLGVSLKAGFFANSLALTPEHVQASPYAAQMAAQGAGLPGQPAAFSVETQKKIAPAWAMPVAIVAIVLSVIGFVPYVGFFFGFLAVLMGSIAVGVGENKGKIAVVIGLIAVLVGVCISNSGNF